MWCSLWVKYIYVVFSMGEVHICGVLYGWSICMWCSLWVKYIYVVFSMGEVYRWGVLYGEVYICGVPYG